ncbi:hypothetical protein [Anaerolentibacter hominis]|uniref:hypothetical protein n=1 Tax=Anaerolentibacter hominis TaxID=3079009 RepID=UPI0031B82077
MEQYRIRIADPAENMTAFVLDEVPEHDYVRVATGILDKKELKIEQVGFVKEPRLGGISRLEMMGGEFCGNAARSFGYMLCENMGAAKGRVPIEITGCDRPLMVEADLAEGWACTDMPVPLGFDTLVIPEMGSLPVVVTEGISHVILDGRKVDTMMIQMVLSQARKQLRFDALGILFLREEYMFPVVYVRETNSLVYESSCGSGSLACGCYRAREYEEGCFIYCFKQPGGAITAQLNKEAGAVSQCQIEGRVSISDIMTVNL